MSSTHEITHAGNREPMSLPDTSRREKQAQKQGFFSKNPFVVESAPLIFSETL
jgi:hypothetical protein